MIFPEDADIRIPPEPSKPCSAKLEVNNPFFPCIHQSFSFVEKIRRILQTFQTNGYRSECSHSRIKRFPQSLVCPYSRFDSITFFRILFSMYEKIISHLDIDEIGTNFPQV